MKKLFCICYLFLVLCGTFPWITSCSGDDVEEVVSVQDVPSDISLFVSAWFPGAMIEQISRINEGERGYHALLSNNVEVDFTNEGSWTRFVSLMQECRFSRVSFWERCTTLWKPNLVRYQFPPFMQSRRD